MAMILIPVIAFVGVAALIGALSLVMRDKGPRAEARLETFTRAGASQTNLENIEIWKERAFESDKKALVDQLMPNLPSVKRLFEQADVHIKPGTLLVMAVIFGVLGGTGSWLARVPLFLVPFPALLLFSVPWCWVLYKRRARLKKFQAQLPDALELVARALRAGHSFAAGMHVVAEEMPPPIAGEFGRVYEEQNYGISIEESLKALCERVPNLDLRFFATSVAIQRQTGGDLAEILDKLGYVIRERFRILGQVRALTGEGRLSGVVLIALPFVLFFVVLHLNPKYVEVLWTDELGIKMSIIALIMQVLGALCIRKIVDIKV
jgi:tight adherence protein B